MSGEKCAQVSLDSEIRAQLEWLSEARTLQATGAHARGEAVDTLALITRDVRQYMVKDWEAFQRLQARVDASAARARQAFDSAERMTISVRDVAGPLAAARGARDAAEGHRREADGLREQARSIASRRIEAVDSARRSELVANLRRTRVASLRASFGAEAARLGRAEPTRTRGFAEELQALEGAADLTDERITRCEKRFTGLLEHVQGIEQDNWERWEIGRRVSEAFCQSGYTEKEGIATPPAAPDDPAHWKLEFKDSRIESVTDLDVLRDKRIQLVMQGRAGSEEVTMAPACDAKLEDVIRRAKELGITIHSVLWKDPDGGWRAIYGDPLAQATELERPAVKEGTAEREHAAGKPE